METIEYYSEYLNLKAHFNTKKFQYGKDHISYLEKWNKEPELRKIWWHRMKRSMTILDFRKMVIAHLLDNPKIYFMCLGQKSDITINFNRYWSNYQYWFEKDMSVIKNQPVELFVGFIHISTLMLLYGLGYFQGNTNTKTVWEEYGFRITKFYELMKMRVEWKIINQIYQTTKEKAI